MRKTVSALIIIFLVWISYVAWPLYDLTAMVRAIDARDVNTMVRYVDFERVRVSFTEQIASAYMRMSGIPPNVLAQQAVVIGGADPVIRRLVSPEALSEFLTVGWPVSVVQVPPPPGSLGINADTLGTAWQIFGASAYGIGRFEVSVPRAAASPYRFRLTFRLLAWRWRLVSITLPENVQNVLANEVIKIMRERR